jgi:hypothetical protein
MNYIKSVIPNNPAYRQGLYQPINVSKYVGEINKIFYRSSLELKFMVFCDKNDKVVKWSSEPFSIPYFNVLDEKIHQYYIDFWILLNENNVLNKYLIEIKPDSQTKEPIFETKYNTPKRLKNYIYEKKNYIVNTCKWKSAIEFSKLNNMQFKILTEKDLEIK